MRFLIPAALPALFLAISSGGGASAHPAGAQQETCANRSATLDGNFPTGAYAKCEAAGAKRFTLTIAPEDDTDINCSAWYAFRLTPEHKGRVTVDLNYTKCGHRYWPKMSTDGVNWEFLPAKSVRIDGEGDDSAATIKVKLGTTPVFIAGQEILPPSVYDAWLDKLSASPDTQRRLLGKSAEGREIHAMTIAAPSGGQRETVVLVGRQHPPEITGALAMLPFVETLLGDSDLAKRYRARFETQVVPMLNPDGVVRGHWRHNTGEIDLNRDWGPFTQPETKLMQTLFNEIAEDPDRQLRLMIDFHSTQRDIFYTIPDDLPTDPPFFTRDWLARFQERMPGYEVTRDARHTAGRPISKAYVFDTYGVPGVTFELGDETDRELIKRIGEQSALAMMETLLATDPK
ncbi:M14 family metallopeptidase [Pontixanthobacter aquaemixtae]|uniref:Peptidase M14 n=1 Tax=Pontixanthobacter aquaemixtae TaxID=1958940 RepID=A0A844ZP67_9SPHN|nr:M14-type cytosolic carboxypeptidase [Pontixanthobacter aquaemixtae]MXO89354.1 peptidase M14 [Pontixanthobacter aquaemixtae]